MNDEPLPPAPYPLPKPAAKQITPAALRGPVAQMVALYRKTKLVPAPGQPGVRRTRENRPYELELALAEPDAGRDNAAFMRFGRALIGFSTDGVSPAERALEAMEEDVWRLVWIHTNKELLAVTGYGKTAGGNGYLVTGNGVDGIPPEVLAREAEHRSHLLVRTDDPVDPGPFLVRCGEGGTLEVRPTGAPLDPARVVAVDCLPAIGGTGQRRTLMTTPLTTPAMRDAAHALFAAAGTPATVIHDSPGFVAQRILACIVNIGCDIAQQRVARPADIDRAVTLGLGYPQGPLAIGDTLGARRVLALLEAMQDFYGDPRYRPSPWLKRRALLGVSLLTEET